jgi:hypothetical protein
MSTDSTRSRPATRRRRRPFQPGLLELEPRTMMAGGLATASRQVVSPTEHLATMSFLGEMADLLAGQSLPDRLVSRLARGLERGSLSREGALRQILQTPQARAELVRDLTQELLDRDPTAAETRSLVAGMRTRGADDSWAILQIMSRPEYFRKNAATNADFVEAATRDLLQRPATWHEVDAAAKKLDRGGAPARTQFLRQLLGGQEFRLVRTQATIRQFDGTSLTPDLQASFLRAYRGTQGHTQMVARVLDNALEIPVKIPTYEENQSLTLKRVPGFLAGWKFDNLAAPFSFAHMEGRKIDARNVDYWAITLNKDDSVFLNIAPDDNLPDTGFASRIWGPDGKELGVAPGSLFGYVASVAGTYTIGISTSDNTKYLLDPKGEHAPLPPSGPTVRTFAADFKTVPGDQTHLIDILTTYKNPAYGKDGWPVFTAAQQAAYDTLVNIGRAGSAQSVADLRDFHDFRQVSRYEPKWLPAVWAPIDAVLQTPTQAKIAQVYDQSLYPQLTHAYSSDQWAAIAGALIDPSNRQAHDAFLSVHTLLANADADRAAIASYFNGGGGRIGLKDWTTTNEANLLGDSNAIADIIKEGVASASKEAAKNHVDQWGWLRSLLNWVGKTVQVVVTAAGAAIGAALGTAGSPVGTIVGAAAGGVIGAAIGSAISDAFALLLPKPPPTPSDAPPVNLSEAASELDSAMKNRFNRTFALLSSDDFLKSVFSNYGLLEAMGRIRFSVPDADTGLKQIQASKRSYDLSVWENLVPKVYSWQYVPYTDSASSLPNFSFYVPVSEDATWQNPTSKPPLGNAQYVFGWNWTSGKFSRPDAAALNEAKAQIISLESGKAFEFTGHDNTPGVDFGPGPISGPRTLTGTPDRFYGIASNATLEQASLWRHAWNPFPDPGGIQAGWWETRATHKGFAIQEWRLMTADGAEIDKKVAKVLFGSGDPTTQGDGLQPYDGGYYVNLRVPSDGLVSRFDVFSQWGADVKGFSPRSFTPSGPASGSTPTLLHPANPYTQFFSNSYADWKLSYTPTRKALTGSARPGPGPSAQRHRTA